MKILATVPDRCTGCGICTLRCSIRHLSTHEPSKSRIDVVGGPTFDSPIICTQCGLCMQACPIDGAMVRNRKTGAIVVTDRCNGCGQCVMACPWGIIKVDGAAHKALKCDLCEGDPECARWCPTGAIVYVNPERASYLRQRNSVKAAEGI